MISKHIKKFCKEDPSKIENYDKAIADTTQVWHCHHRDEVRTLPSGMVVIRSSEELIENDRYYNCPANELIFLTNSEHIKLHSTVRKCSELTKSKISKSNKGQIRSIFANKFKEHYNITKYDDIKLYEREKSWYYGHSCKCRWEVNK